MKGDRFDERLWSNAPTLADEETVSLEVVGRELGRWMHSLLLESRYLVACFDTERRPCVTQESFDAEMQWRRAVPRWKRIRRSIRIALENASP